MPNTAHINLASGTVEITPTPETLTRALLGGRGMNMFYLRKHLRAAGDPRAVDPFGPENPLIFGAGLLTGTIAPNAARFNVSAKSPESLGLGDANCGGFFAAAMRKAGFDRLIIVGRAERPCYVLVGDGRISIRDADGLWGTTSAVIGPFWYVFWGGQLLLGALIPLFLIFNKRTGNSVGWLGAAAALIVIGIVGVRLNIVIPPFSVPLMPGVDTAYPLGRFSTFDFAGLARTMFTLAIVVFVIAAGVITARLSQLPPRRTQRWLARAAGTVMMLGFVVMGLRFLGIGTPIAASLFGEQVGLPFFFGGVETPVFTASTAGTPANLPLFFGGSVRATDAAFYSPSAIEWLSSMGVIALAAIGFSLGWLILPLQGESDEEHEPRRRSIAELAAGR